MGGLPNSYLYDMMIRHTPACYVYCCLVGYDIVKKKETIEQALILHREWIENAHHYLLVDADGTISA